MPMSLPYALASETTIHPANKKHVLDGFGDDWRDLEGAPKLSLSKERNFSSRMTTNICLFWLAYPTPPISHCRMIGW